MKEQIINLISNSLTDSVEIDLDTELLDSGLLDSFGVLVLISEINKVFDISLNIDGEIRNHFVNARKIILLIESSIK